MARTIVRRGIDRRAADRADPDPAFVVHLHRIRIAFVVRQAVLAVVAGGAETVALRTPAEHAVVGAHQQVATAVAHDGASFGNFSTSTRHMQQTPATGSPGW